MKKANKRRLVTDAEVLERDADMLERRATYDYTGASHDTMAREMAQKLRRAAHAIRSGKIRGVPVR